MTIAKFVVIFVSPSTSSGSVCICPQGSQDVKMFIILTCADKTKTQVWFRRLFKKVDIPFLKENGN